MNGAHLHLLMNHAPLFGIYFGLFLLVLGMATRKPDVQMAAFVLFVLAGILILPVYLTGEAAEEIVEPLPGVSEPLMEAHEDSATISAIAIGLLGIVAIAGILLGRKSVGIWPGFLRAGLVLGLLAALLIARTANLGGKVRHSEIRSDTAAAVDIDADDDDDD